MTIAPMITASARLCQNTKRRIRPSWPDLARRRRGDDDALRVDHFAHDAARAVGGHDQHRVEAELLRGDLLQAAEEHVRTRVRSGQGHAEPAEQGGEERIEHAGLCERQAERRIGSAVSRDEAERKHQHDRRKRRPHAPQCQEGNRDELRERDAAGTRAVAIAASRMAVPVADTQLSVNTAASARSFRYAGSLMRARSTAAGTTG